MALLLTYTTLLRKQVPRVLNYYLFDPLVGENIAEEPFTDEAGHIHRCMPLQCLRATLNTFLPDAVAPSEDQLSHAIEQTPLEYYLQPLQEETEVFAQGKDAEGAWLVREIGNRLKQFMTNLPEENLLLAEILKFMCSMPVRQEVD